MIKKEKNGVTLYYEKSRYGATKIVDIDVKPGISSVEFFYYEDNDDTMMNISLSKIKKQFNDVTELIIPDNISFVCDIPNMMFPNVNHIKSHNNCYFDDTDVLIKKKYSENILINAFRKNKDSVIDLKDIDTIDSYALDGCLATKFINDNKYTCNRSMDNFIGSSVMTMKHFKDNVFKLNTSLINIDTTADRISIPKNIVLINKGIKFNESNTIELTEKQLLLFGAYIDCNTVYLNESCILDTSALNGAIYSKNLEINQKNSLYTSVNGMLYSKDKSCLLICPKNKNDNFILDENTKYISCNAFSYCRELEHIKLNDELKSIMEDSFCFCSNLKSIEFNKNLETIGKKAFFHCDFENLVIPSNVKYIRERAFFGNKNLKAVVLNEGLEVIENYAFFGCSKLTSISIPKTVKFVGENFIPSSVKDVYVDREYPEDIIKGIIKNSANYVLFNAIRLHIDGYGTVLIPASMSQDNLEKFNNIFNSRFLDKAITNKLYEYAIDVEAKQNVAIQTYKETKDKDIEAYLRRAGKSIAKRFINFKNEESLIEFLELDILTSKSLKELLKLIDDENFVSAKAYILNALDNNQDSKTSFRL